MYKINTKKNTPDSKRSTYNSAPFYQAFKDPLTNFIKFIKGTKRFRNDFLFNHFYGWNHSDQFHQMKRTLFVDIKNSLSIRLVNKWKELTTSKHVVDEIFKTESFYKDFFKNNPDIEPFFPTVDQINYLIPFKEKPQEDAVEKLQQKIRNFLSFNILERIYKNKNKEAIFPEKKIIEFSAHGQIYINLKIILYIRKYIKSKFIYFNVFSFSLLYIFFFFKKNKGYLSRAKSSGNLFYLLFLNSV